MSYNYSFENNSFDQTMSSQTAAPTNSNLNRNGYYEDVDELNSAAVPPRLQMQNQKVARITVFVLFLCDEY